MRELTLRDIEVIRADIIRQEISFSHLAEDLLDHLCCDVEDEMSGGMDFSEAYRRVRERMGPRRMKEIQEETLYVVDSKYRKMKSTMKISGIAGTVLLGFASLFKIMHWPLAGILMVLGGMILSFVFMPTALGVLWKETHNSRKIVMYISAFLATMLFTMGVVFKIQHWPGAAKVLGSGILLYAVLLIPALLISKIKEAESLKGKMIYVVAFAGLLCYILGFYFKIEHMPFHSLLLTAAIVIIFFISFPWYVITTWKSEKNVSPKFIYMVVGSLALVIPSLLINLNMQRNYAEGFFIHKEEQDALYRYELGKNSAFIEKCSDSILLPALKEIDIRTKNLVKVINDTEVNLITASVGNTPESVAMAGKILEGGVVSRELLSYIRKPFTPVPAELFLLDKHNTLEELDCALKDYNAYLSDVVPGYRSGNYSFLLNTSLYLPDINSGGVGLSPVSALHRLSLMKNSILAVESHALSAVSGITE